ncbi:hypothetical protein CDAR_174501 [Caerostris darwini]|uniref:Uncharacterized protein n=1 Tax=Caerostris darwini TaxID=1538125 RepID=A0AAV4PHG0_9ARAC|nr:hypothetical protein CDAR_174501 [Caerostris darwini]
MATGKNFPLFPPPPPPPQKREILRGHPDLFRNWHIRSLSDLRRGLGNGAIITPPIRPTEFRERGRHRNTVNCLANCGQSVRRSPAMIGDSLRNLYLGYFGTGRAEEF